MIARANGKNGDRIGQLAFGCMRLPGRRHGGVVSAATRAIDMDASQRLVDRAVDAGVNYFDTAWMYPGNEIAVGRLLAPHRARVHIATKMPMYLVKRPEDFSKYFEESLERLGTDRIDYYLLHMLVSAEEFRTYADWGIGAWAEREKARGRIRNLGFSFHGNAGAFKKIIDAHAWDFCMIQYNYIDTAYQAGTDGLKHAAAAGVPVMVMEPLRGGKLARLPNEAITLLDGVRPGRSAAEWGLRWVWNHPEVLTVLSGMNSPEQLEENLRIARDAAAGAMAAEETEALARVAEIINREMKVPCTGCEYCLPCPAGVNIPAAFRYYNGDTFANARGPLLRYAIEAGVLPDRPAWASQCVACGKCTEHCPQHIDIPKELAAARREIERFWSKPAARVVKAFTTGNRR
jgi:predicted aldo/keto reductase-like oxidoreductase